MSIPLNPNPLVQNRCHCAPKTLSSPISIRVPKRVLVPHPTVKDSVKPWNVGRVGAGKVHFGVCGSTVVAEAYIFGIFRKNFRAFSVRVVLMR